ncbi:hypothetical protein [Streptomyces sp. ST2-7A]|uniref:hypothetical protein n=1 Tax=Streptomyces sp. ST2-7A TaxID=2907214 RepID=UPI001F24CDD9|nr:hypothetical protein [Streptomyces sp. ST2-7A]MCE7080414.1 hypothetical protein [Streptomyces sp. ST2-7A]
MPASRAVTATVAAVIALPLIWVGGLTSAGPVGSSGADGVPVPVPAADDVLPPPPGSVSEPVPVEAVPAEAVTGPDVGAYTDAPDTADAPDSVDPPVPADSGAEDAPGAAGGLAPAGAPPGGRARSAGVRCGPPVTAPVGLEARACVVTDREGTRARVSHRNDDGRALRVELSLTRPDGRVVTRVCAFPDRLTTGWCETPAQPHVAVGSAGTGVRRGWSATAELLPADGEVPLLRARGADEP